VVNSPRGIIALRKILSKGRFNLIKGSTIFLGSVISMSLSGCAPEREYSESEKLNSIGEALDGTSALREARESEIARENLQIYLMAGILVVLLIVALVLIFRKKAK
jgi:hypothetical protein